MSTRANIIFLHFSKLRQKYAFGISELFLARIQIQLPTSNVSQGKTILLAEMRKSETLCPSLTVPFLSEFRFILVICANYGLDRFLCPKLT